jgi:hypothetical protein
MLKCKKCKGRVLVDRVFTTQIHIEIYCINCGKRDMFHYPQNCGEYAQWIFQIEKERAKFMNIPL